MKKGIWLLSLGTVCASLCSSTCQFQRGNGKCVSSCATKACNWDYGNCIKSCTCNITLLGNDYCDQSCNTPDCLYDGGDCTGLCNEGCPLSDLGNGICQSACNNLMCNYDNGDCPCTADLLQNGVCDSICQFPEYSFDMGDCAEFIYVNATEPGPGGSGSRSDPYQSLEVALNHNFSSQIAGLCFVPGTHNLTKGTSVSFASNLTTLFISCRPCSECVGTPVLLQTDKINTFLSLQNLTLFWIENLVIDGSQKLQTGCSQSICMFCNAWRCTGDVCVNELNEVAEKTVIPPICFMTQSCSPDTVLTVNLTESAYIQDLVFLNASGVVSLVRINSTFASIANITVQGGLLQGYAIAADASPGAKATGFRILTGLSSSVVLQQQFILTAPSSILVSNVTVREVNLRVKQGLYSCSSQQSGEAGALSVVGYVSVQVEQVFAEQVYNFMPPQHRSALVYVESAVFCIVKNVVLRAVQSSLGGLVVRHSSLLIQSDFNATLTQIQEIVVTDSLFSAEYSAAVSVLGSDLSPIAEVSNISCSGNLGLSFLIKNVDGNCEQTAFTISGSQGVFSPRYILVGNVTVVSGGYLLGPTVSLINAFNALLNSVEIAQSSGTLLNYVIQDAQTRFLLNTSLIFDQTLINLTSQAGFLCTNGTLDLFQVLNLTFRDLTLRKNVCITNSIMNITDFSYVTMSQTRFQGNEGNETLQINPRGFGVVFRLENGEFIENNVVNGAVVITDLSGTSQITVDSVWFQGNIGQETAGIASSAGELTVLNSVFTNNTSDVQAAGLTLVGASYPMQVTILETQFFLNTGNAGVDLTIETTVHLTLQILNCSFQKTTGHRGTVISIETGTVFDEFWVRNSVVSDCTADTYMGVVSFGEATGVLRFYNSTFGCNSNGNAMGSIIYADISPNTAEMPSFLLFTDCFFTQNFASVLFMVQNPHSRQTMFTQNCSFSLNSGILFALLNAEMSDQNSVFLQNSNSESVLARGLYNASLVMTGSRVWNNTSKGDLLSISESSYFSIRNATVGENLAAYSIFSITKSWGIIAEVLFEHNYVESGGCVWTQAGVLYVSETAFQTNQVNTALLDMSISTLVITAVDFFQETELGISLSGTTANISQVTAHGMRKPVLSAEESSVRIDGFTGDELTNDPILIFAQSTFSLLNLTLVNVSPVALQISDASSGSISLSTFSGLTSTATSVTNSNLTLQNSVFTSNKNSAVSSIYSWIAVSDCRFENNTQESVLDFRDTNIDISNSTFRNNSAVSGAGLYLACESSICSATISDSEFSFNSAVDGGAIFYTQKRPGIVNTRFEGNQARHGDDFATVASYLTLESAIPEAASGQQYPSITVAIRDTLGQVVASDNESVGQLIATDNSSVKGITRITAQNGVFTFTGVELTHSPNSVGAFEVSTAAVSTLVVNIPFRTCVVGEILLPGATCYVCAEYTYSINLNDQTCTECPVGAKCLGGANISPEPGYWMAHILTNKVYNCPQSDSCFGAGVCAPGYESNLCASCSDGYYRFGGTLCKKCMEPLINISLCVLTVLTFLVVVTLIVRATIIQAGKSKSQLALHLKLLVNYVQVTMLLGNFNLNWPSMALGLFQTSSVTGDSAQLIFAVECSDFFPNSLGAYTFVKAVLATVMPLLEILLSTLIWAFVAYLTGKYERIYLHNTTTILTVLLLMHSSINNHVLGLFACKELEGVMWLIEDYAVECWQTQHMKFILLIGIPGFILWVIGLPCLMLAILIKKKSELKDRANLIKFGFLYNGYKQQFRFWEVIILYRKLLLRLTSLVLAFADNITAALTALIVMFVAVILQSECKPFELDNINELEFAALMANVSTLSFGVFLAMSETAVWESVWMAAIMSVNIGFLVYWGLSLMRVSRFLQRLSPTRASTVVPTSVSHVGDIELRGGSPRSEVIVNTFALSDLSGLEEGGLCPNQSLQSPLG